MDEELTLIYDNARAHADPPRMAEGKVHKALPPNSPFLNMTERAISGLTAALKRSFAELHLRRDGRCVEVPRNQGITMQKYRLRLLQREVENYLPIITAIKCRQ